MEERAGRRADRLGVVGVDRLAGIDHESRSRGVRRPQHRAGVAGIAHADQDDDQGAVPGRPRTRPGRRLLEHGEDGEHGLGRDGVCHPLQHAGAQGEHPHPGGIGAAAHLLDGAIVGAVGRDVEGLDRNGRVERAADELCSLGHEGALAPARRTLLQQPAQPADPPVREGQPLGQEATSATGALDSASCAVATSAPKASGSLTARSARTLRSTSTPVRCNPLMSLL